MSLFSIFDRVRWIREQRLANIRAPRRGPTMIVAAYRDEAMDDCPRCKDNKDVIGYNPGSRGQIPGCYHYFECKNCGMRF